MEKTSVQDTRGVRSGLVAFNGAVRATLRALVGALRARDAETFRHSRRVLRLAVLLGRECGVAGAELSSLAHGALLHDLGKIGVPDSVLRKPGRLTAGEWELMRRHSRTGQQILRGIRFLDPAATAVLQHHEKWDGSGYPCGLRGDAIDLKARILAVVDAFDAMVCGRVYRAGRSYESAAGELERCAGTHFDPALVETFLRMPRPAWLR